MKLILSAVLSLLVLGSSAQPIIERLDGSSIKPSALTGRVQALADSAGVTGLAVSIFNNGQVIYSKAFGLANAGTREYLTTGQIFYGASLSKAVFGYLVVQLVLEGITDLDKPLQQYMDVPIPEMIFEKEWKGFQDLAGDKRVEAITARMCLSHTTGLPNWRWIGRNGEFQPDGKLQFYFDPGTQYSYSGEGMMLLQYVIEHITGKGLEQLARERVFDPLQMDMTSYVWQKRFNKSYCYGHTTDGKAIPKDTEDEAGAAGSMETTPEDFSKFAQHLLNLSSDSSVITRLMFEPGINIRTKRQFGPLAQELTNENSDIELSYGLGWGLLNSPYGSGAFKEGHGEGFQHYTILFPGKKTGIVLLSNSDNAESIFKELLEISIGDIYTPWEWESYIPFDYKQ